MRVNLIIFATVATLAIMLLEVDSQNERGGKPGQAGGKQRHNITREKAKNERRAGGAKLGLFKKGAAFEMDRKNKSIRFQILNVLETKLDNSTVTYKVDEIDFNLTKTSNDSNYGVPADMTVVEGKLENKATIIFTMIIFRENGTITTDDGYEFDVLEGALKFNLELDWPYETKTLDPTIALKCFHGRKGRKGKKSKKGKGKRGSNAKGNRPPETFGFCESVRITFSSTYKSNNTWLDMPEGYPIAKLSEGSGWSRVTLRFKGQKVVYDPITEIGSDIEASDTNATDIGNKTSCVNATGADSCGGGGGGGGGDAGSKASGHGVGIFTLIGAFLITLMIFM